MGSKRQPRINAGYPNGISAEQFKVFDNQTGSMIEPRTPQHFPEWC